MNFKGPGNLFSHIGRAVGFSGNAYLKTALTQCTNMGRHFELEFKGLEQQASRAPTYVSEMTRFHEEINKALEINKAAFRELFRSDKLTYGVAKFQDLAKNESCPKYDNVLLCMCHLLKDWTEHMEFERRPLYDKVVKDLEEHVGTGAYVVVPCCGQGRLPYELARQDYQVTGYELSMPQVLCAHHVINQQDSPIDFYPYLHEQKNHRDSKSRLFKATVPIYPKEKLPLRILRGDYSQQRETNVDAIILPFALDCFSDLLGIASKIYSELKTGGIVIFFGPLHYHWDNTQTEYYPNPTFEHIVYLMKDLGFEVIRSHQHDYYYAYLEENMKQEYWRCEYCVFRKL